ncbi:interleukin-17A-like [Anomaloglossus baeobatrachus]
MYPPKATVLVSLLFLIFGVSYGKKCNFSKELMLTQNTTFLNGAPDDIRQRSLSPWRYRQDKDENRHPTIINEAVCDHDWCLDSDGNKDLSKNSVPITYNMLVLRREVANCQKNFRLELQLVTVGCTCSKPIIHVVS